MGCFYSKNSAVEDSREGNTNKFDVNSWRLNSRKRVEAVRVKDEVLDIHSSDVKVSFVNKKANSSMKLYDDKKGVDKIEKPESVFVNIPSFGRVPKAVEGENVAAGWPSWLSSVAGDAIKGWIPRSAKTFERLHKIGQGTYSTVYKAHDLTNQKIVALKRVRFDNLDPESVKFMAREIHVLRRLDHPNIIKLEGLITSSTSHSLYLVFEYMEHDLTGLASNPAIKFSEPQLKCYVQQLLSGLDHCHSHGVLHRDIKGSNLLIDNNGVLKIADFGLASYFDPHHSVPMTNRVVTLWYRPPELLLGANHYGVAVDLWSVGCILGELYTGRPILPGKTEVEQLHRIFKLCGSPSEDYWHNLHLPHSTAFRPPHHYRRYVAETFKEYPYPAVRLIETLLSVDPAHRRTAAAALESEFFTSEPLACDPSTLPKYPHSKEIDAKLRNETTRRQGAVGGREKKVGSGVRQEKGLRAYVTAADPGMSIQQEQRYSSSKNHSGLLKPHREPVSGFLVFPPHEKPEDGKEVRNNLSGRVYKKPSHSGPLVPGYSWAKSGREVDGEALVSNRVNLSELSGLVASRTMSSQDQEEKPVHLHHRKPVEVRKSLESTSRSESRRQDKKRIADRTQIDSGKVPSEKLTRDGHGPRRDKIYMSGPLLVQSNNMDVMLKEHDRKIREFSRKARLDKSRARDDKISAKRK
ncbi:PREDICTED: probable serine/threonine-protein kinase At1g54610 [Lupinus angustifolius]|uniref:probable serine/threonine-protein kinase At1g54610 n=1 Tax=Lupinus angustifolius TaxID=3871 RepID=UPI00092EDFB7|nr:PREDICTED: probable serine/threonine-protein kinase At1g54610 [Lupinus angustifolius]